MHERTTRARTRGLTLVELVVVIALIGLLASAIAVGVFARWRDGQSKTAALACNQLRAATQAHLVDHPDDPDCPTPEGLQHEKELDATMSLRDPWGTAYAIECQPDEFIAKSAGPDRAFGTDDDIVVPGARHTAGVATRR
jgi:general secretion pathway protein G